MEYRRLGRTGLKVSRLCLGTMQWGWTADEEQSGRVMDAFVAAGGNFLDTADVYSNWIEGNPGGVSEEIIGRWMKARGTGNRSFSRPRRAGGCGMGLMARDSAASISFAPARTRLRRLDTDYIDLYQTHSSDRQTPVDETMRALDDLVRAGKVRYAGCSNYAAWELTKALWMSDKHNLARYESLQPHYNLARRAEFERELKLLCEEEGIGVIPYSPLAGGFLTGKYRRDHVPESARTGTVQRRYLNDRGFDLLDRVDEVASARGHDGPGRAGLAVGAGRGHVPHRRRELGRAAAGEPGCAGRAAQRRRTGHTGPGKRLGIGRGPDLCHNCGAGVSRRTMTL